MTDRAVRTVNLARQAADHLANMGEAKRAEDVRALIRSNTAYRATLQLLQRDNLELRASLHAREASHDTV